MKKRERLWDNSKDKRFLRLVYFYDVTKNLKPKDKRLLKKGLKK